MLHNCNKNFTKRSTSCGSLPVLLFTALYLVFLIEDSQGVIIPLPRQPHQFLEIHGLRANTTGRLMLLIHPINNPRRRIGQISVWYRDGAQAIGAIRKGKRLTNRIRTSHELQPGEKAVVIVERSGTHLNVYLKDERHETIFREYLYNPVYGVTPLLRHGTLHHEIKNFQTGLGMFQSCGETKKRIPVNNMSLCNITLSERYLGTTPAAGGDIPWQVAILRKQNGRPSDHICGGVLIGECAALTAAHCVPYWRNPSSYQVRVGDYYNQDDPEGRFRKFENSQTFDVNTIYIHLNYSLIPYPVNDIALIALQKNTTTQNCVTIGPFVQPACLQWPGTLINTKACRISGWGASYFGENYNKYINCLLFAHVKIWDMRDCEQSYRGGMMLRDQMFCANSVYGRRQITDTCQGDSGGPLVCDDMEYKGIVVGIASFGDECGGPRPGVYTKIDAYLRWLEVALLKSDKYRSANEMRLAVP